jgi:hypothetical protein
MTVSGFGPRSWRRAAMTFVMIGLVAAGTGHAFTQATPPQQPATPPAPAQPDAFTFKTDMLLFFPVAEGATADFEMVLNKIKELLTKSEKPERQAQAKSIQVFRIEPAANGISTYAMLVSPAVKDVSYDFGKILSEGMPPDQVQGVFQKLTGSLKGQLSMSSVSKILGGGSN